SLAAHGRLVVAGTLVRAIMLQYPALDVVRSHQEQDFVNQATLERFVQNRKHDFDAAPKVARHPVRAGAKDFVLPAVLEMKNARMLQIAIDDGMHPNFLADAFDSRPQTANATHQ